MPALPPWAISVLVSVLVIALNVLLAWWLDRIRRTLAAAEVLMSSNAMQALLMDKDDHSDRVAKDKQYWLNYQREVLGPALNAIERFAAPAVSGFPRIYSKNVIRRLACESLVSIWKVEDVEHFVGEMRKRSENPETIYGDFERLATWLKAHPLRHRRGVVRRVVDAVRRPISSDMSERR